MSVVCFLIPQFGIACERARLPTLWGEPVALASPPEKGASHTEIITLSDEARLSGILPKQSVTSARALCPLLIVIPYDTTAYQLAARSVWDLFAIECSCVEPLSPEICFLEIPEINKMQELALALEARLCVPVRVGIARTKLLALLAAQQANLETPSFYNNRIYTIFPEREALFLAPIPLEMLPGFPSDKALACRLQKLGVRTAGDIQRLSLQELQRQFDKQSYRLQRLAYGDDDDPVRPLWPPRQLTRSIHFETEIIQLQTVQLALERSARSLALALARERSYCRRCHLEICLAEGEPLYAEEILPQPLNDHERLTAVALRLLSRLRPQRPLVSLTLAVRDLGAGSGIQLSLLDLLDRGEGTGGAENHRESSGERRSHLQSTLAYLRLRYGVGSIVVASLLHHVRQLDFWTYPLTRRQQNRIEPLEVSTDSQGTPTRFCYRGEEFLVLHVQNRWREVEQVFSTNMKPLVRTAFRLETDPPGLYEIHRIGQRWRLGAIAD